MAIADNQNISLGEAASRFLTKLPAREREASQQEVLRFVRWYGRERPLSGLSAPEIASYAEQLSSSDTDYAGKLELIRAFLLQSKKAGWSQTNLAVHLKTKKKTTPPASGRPGLPEAISLTQKGYAELQHELAALKNERHEVIDEMRRAAADKDFRENAPLQAARERRGHLEGRIKELEETMKRATVISNGTRASVKVSVGDSVLLADTTSDERLRYTIVNPKETDPLKGKISSASPIGKAIIGRSEGEVIEVAAPAGKLRYRIERIERS